MGWMPCSQCGSKKWKLFVHPEGCNICDPDLEERKRKENEEFFHRFKDRDLVGGFSIID